jgi:hypothetical protein
MVGTSSQSVPVAWPLSISLGTTGTIYDVTFFESDWIWGVPQMGGTPIAGWFVMENPPKKWIIEGYPHFRTPPKMFNTTY